MDFLGIFAGCAIICACCAGCFVLGTILRPAPKDIPGEKIVFRQAPRSMGKAAQPKDYIVHKTAPITLTEEHEMNVESASCGPDDSEGGQS